MGGRWWWLWCGTHTTLQAHKRWVGMGSTEKEQKRKKENGWDGGRGGRQFYDHYFEKPAPTQTQCVTPPGHVGADETKKTLWHIGGVEGEGKVWAARKRFCVFLLASSATAPFFPPTRWPKEGSGLVVACVDAGDAPSRSRIKRSRASGQAYAHRESLLEVGVGKTLNFDEGSNKHRAG